MAEETVLQQIEEKQQFIDPKEAAVAIKKEKMERAARAMEKVMEILKQENCFAEPQIVFQGDRIVQQGIIVTAYDGIPEKGEES